MPNNRTRVSFSDEEMAKIDQALAAIGDIDLNVFVHEAALYYADFRLGVEASATPIEQALLEGQRLTNAQIAKNKRAEEHEQLRTPVFRPSPQVRRGRSLD